MTTGLILTAALAGALRFGWVITIKPAGLAGDRVLNAIWPMRTAARARFAATTAPDLTGTAVSTTTGCATTGGAGHPSK